MYHAIMIVQNQCVSANFHGEYQSNQEAEQKIVFGIFKKTFLISAVW